MLNLHRSSDSICGGRAMHDLAGGCDAIFGATVFLSHFNDLSDPRQAVKVVYPRDEVLLLAVLAGAETFTDIARFGDKKPNLLRRFRPFRDGTPRHDRIGEIFAALDAEQFLRCCVAWVAPVSGIPAGVVAIDGKTVRRSGQKARGMAPVHMIPAFAARRRPGAWSGQSSGKAQRDHSDPQTFAHAGERRGDRDHRCDGRGWPKVPSGAA